MKEQEAVLVKPDCLAPAEIEAKTEMIGATKASADTKKTFLLAIMAGMYIGMGGMFMLLIKTATGVLPFALHSLLGGLVFCLGLFLVVVAGAELFTGNVLMVCGGFSKKYAWSKIFKNWVVVWIGNFVGSLVLVSILFFANFGGLDGGAVSDAMIKVATAKVALSPTEMFFRGIMCNFLVCLAVWISFSAKTVVDKFFGILLPITGFVACGFEHCVANMFFLPMGLLMKLTATHSADFDLASASALDVAGIATNIGIVTLGNLIGGVVLVGLVYWAAYHKKEAL